MAYRSRPLPFGRGGGPAPAESTDMTDASSGPFSSSLHGRGLRRPGRQPTTTATNTSAPLLASRGRKALHIGRLARRSAMVAESDKPAAEGIML